MNKNCSYWKLILRYSLHIRFRDKLGVKVVKALKRNDDGVTHAAIDMLCALMQVRARNLTQCFSQNLTHVRLVWLLCCAWKKWRTGTWLDWFQSDCEHVSRFVCGFWCGLIWESFEAGYLKSPAGFSGFSSFKVFLLTSLSASKISWRQPLLHSWEQLHCILLAQLAIIHRGQFCWGSSISKVRRYTCKPFLVRSRDVHVYNPWAMNRSEESMFTCILWCQRSPWPVNNQ